MKFQVGVSGNPLLLECTVRAIRLSWVTKFTNMSGLVCCLDGWLCLIANVDTLMHYKPQLVTPTCWGIGLGIEFMCSCCSSESVLRFQKHSDDYSSFKRRKTAFASKHGHPCRIRILQNTYRDNQLPYRIPVIPEHHRRQEISQRHVDDHAHGESIQWFHAEGRQFLEACG